MKAFVSAKAMGRADEMAIREFGIPAFALMESAGRESAKISADLFNDTAKNVVILCGKGNNGGDGFAFARYILGSCSNVLVVHISKAVELSATASEHFTVLNKVAQTADILSVTHLDEIDIDSVRPDVIVDALLGTGMQSNLRRPLSDLVDWANKQNAFRIALDLPTGLHPDTGAIGNPVFRADITFRWRRRRSGWYLAMVRCTPAGNLPSTLESRHPQ